MTDPSNNPAPSLISACDATQAALSLGAAATDGTYALTVTLADAAGNTSATTATYTLLPPAPVVSSPGPAWT